MSGFVVCASTKSFAQTTAITYNGNLSESGLPANGNFDFQFVLFDAATNGNQIGSVLTQANIAVANGNFAATLDFGAAAFPGANRWLQVFVRHTGMGAYIAQTPRTQLTSSPYAIRSLNFTGILAGDVTGTQVATVIANDAVTTDKIANGAVTTDKIANGAVTTDKIANDTVTTEKIVDSSVTDAKIINVAGSKVSGTIPVASIPAGSQNYIRNGSTQQTSGNFNISGSGIATGRITNDQLGITNPNPISNLPPSALFAEETAANDVTAGIIGKADAQSGIGMIGVTGGTDSTGLFGVATSLTGSTTGVQALVFSPGGTAIQALNNGNGGVLFQGRGNGNRQFLVDSQANLTTDGSALIHGRMDVDGHLSVGGNIAVSNLVAVGRVSGSSIGISGGGTINGTLETGTVTAANLTSGFGFIGGFQANSATVYGNMNVNGDLAMGGDVGIVGDLSVSGTKQGVVKLPDGRTVGLYAVESPESWFEDFGTVRLRHGRVWIKLDPTFTKTVNVNIPYKVFLTPDGNCRGLYVAKKSATGFEVRELGGGRSNVTFDYRVIAKRLSYEKERFGVGSPKSETAR